MKNSYSRHLGKVSRRTGAYILLSLLFASILLYSCRKMNFAPPEDNKPPIDPAAVMTRNDLLAWYDDLPIEDQNELNAATGLVSGNGKVPFALQWEKAQQRILNGKHVVRVPINDNALLVFEKEGNNGPLIAYAYKWQPNTNKGAQYSGDVIRFSFQDYSVAALQFQKSKQTGGFIFPNARPIDLDQLKTVKDVLKTQKAGNKFRINTLKSQSFFSFLGSILTAIVDVVHAAGCTITNRNYEWSDGNIVHDPLGADPTDTYTAGKCGDNKIFEIHLKPKNPNAPGSNNGFDGDVEDSIGGGGFLTIGGSFGYGGSTTGGGTSGGGTGGGGSSGGGSSGTGSSGVGWGVGQDLSTQFWTKFNQVTGGNYTITSPGYTTPAPPPPLVSSTQVNTALANLNNLETLEITWINNHTTDSWGKAVVLASQSPLSNHEKMMIKKHIDLMHGYTQVNYAKVVNGYYYHTNLGTTAPYMWWQDPTYIGSSHDDYTNESLYWLGVLNEPAAGDTYIDANGNTLQYTTLLTFIENNASVVALFEQGDVDQITWPTPILPMLGVDYARAMANNYQVLLLQHPDWSQTRLIATATWDALSGTVHFALDVFGLIPGEGSVANFINAAIYYAEGDKINTAISVGSMLPVWSWVKTGGKWVRQAAKVTAMPVTAGAIKYGRQAIIAGNNVRFIKVAVEVFDYATVKALKAIKPADQTLTSISSYLVDQFGHRIKPTQTALKNIIDDIAIAGDAAGTKTENLSHAFFETEGYVKYEGQFGGNTGFDGVYIKGPLSNPTDIIINEAKQMSVVGSIKLNAANPGTGLPAQMSDAWVTNVINRMSLQGGNLATLAQTLQNNRSLVTKTVTAVDKARKEFVVLKVGAY